MRTSATAPAHNLETIGAGAKVGSGLESCLAPNEVVSTIEKHVLLDGFRFVVDLVKSRGSRLIDAVSGRELWDFYGFHGSMAVGFNHPRFDRPEVQREALEAARSKVANSDVLSVPYATFVRTFER